MKAVCFICRFCIQESTSHKWKILDESKCMCTEPVQTLLLFISPKKGPCNTYLYNIYILLGNLKMIYTIHMEVSRLYANTTQFYIRGLKIHGFKIVSCTRTKPYRYQELVVH
jgi:hypothetical protein